VCSYKLGTPGLSNEKHLSKILKTTLSLLCRVEEILNKFMKVMFCKLLVLVSETIFCI